MQALRRPYNPAHLQHKKPGEEGCRDTKLRARVRGQVLQLVKARRRMRKRHISIGSVVSGSHGVPSSHGEEVGPVDTDGEVAITMCISFLVRTSSQVLYVVPGLWFVGVP